MNLDIIKDKPVDYTCINCSEEFEQPKNIIDETYLLLCEDCRYRLQSPIDYVFDMIERHPKKYYFKCDCGTENTISTLDFYSNCPKCGKKVKHRSFGADKEIADIICLVRRWLKEGDNENG